jgi:uncharacterized alpha-E superfamily protein
VHHHLKLAVVRQTSLITSLAWRDNARQVREALSGEAENLSRLSAWRRYDGIDLSPYTGAPVCRGAGEINALEGVTYSTLIGEGWYFLELGRHIEQVQQLGRLLDIRFSAAQNSENSPNVSTGWC